MSGSDELADLRRVSARLGRDPHLVQAAGGNTSLKLGNVMWVKASGLYLARAMDQEVMVPVDLPAMLRALNSGDEAAGRPADFTLPEFATPGLRPSIETVVHALMPQRVVIHVHCVDTISIAIRADARAVLEERLSGVDWALVPYVRPGLPLARAISAEMGAQTNVLVLRNHGLVVGADSVTEAEQLLECVCRQLRRAPRQAPAADLDTLNTLARGAAYRLPTVDDSHTVACDPVSCRIAAAGSLYPDQVVYLGGTAVIAGPGDTAADVAAAVLDKGQPLPPAILFPGKGVLIHADASPGVEPLAQCLSLVTARVPPDATLTYLTAEQEAELLGWEASRYRRSLDRRETAH